MTKNGQYQFFHPEEIEDLKRNFYNSGWTWGFGCGIIVMLVIAIGVVLGY